MGKVKICADSVCDLSEELKNRYDISVVPLYVTKGEETLRDGVEIGQNEVFAYYRSTGKLCSTSAVNVEDFAGFFKEQLDGLNSVRPYADIPRLPQKSWRQPLVLYHSAAFPLFPLRQDPFQPALPPILRPDPRPLTDCVSPQPRHCQNRREENG